jgi:hypothetical protein
MVGRMVNVERWKAGCGLGFPPELEEEAMNEPTLEAVMQRLGNLECEARWWKMLEMTAVVLLGLIVLLGASATHQATVAQEIRAQRIVLVDDEGHEGGKLGVAPDGGRT